MTQLALPLPQREAPRAEGVWADLGRWMVGEGPEPVELAVLAVARRHRRRVLEASGQRWTGDDRC